MLHEEHLKTSRLLYKVPHLTPTTTAISVLLHIYAHPALGGTGIAKHYNIKKHSYKTHTLSTEFTFLIRLPGVAMKQ